MVSSPHSGAEPRRTVSRAVLVQTVRGMLPLSQLEVKQSVDIHDKPYSGQAAHHIVREFFYRGELVRRDVEVHIHRGPTPAPPPPGVRLLEGILGS